MGCRLCSQTLTKTPSNMKLTLLFLAVAIASTSAFSFGKLKDKVSSAVKDKVSAAAKGGNKDKVEEILAKAKAEAENFFEGKADLDVRGKFEGAMNKAKEMIENAKDMTEDEKNQALEKGKAFFEDMANKLKGAASAGKDKLQNLDLKNAGKLKEALKAAQEKAAEKKAEAKAAFEKAKAAAADTDAKMKIEKNAKAALEKAKAEANEKIAKAKAEAE